MTLDVMPYMRLRSGDWNFSDAFIGDLYRKMAAEGNAPVVFYEGRIRSPESFTVFAKEVTFFLFGKNRKTMGFCWLDRYDDRAARMHFCAFGLLPEEASEIADTILSHTGHVDVLLGLIPETNPRAIAFLDKCPGAQRVGRVPQAIWIAAEERSVAGILFAHERKV